MQVSMKSIVYALMLIICKWKTVPIKRNWCIGRQKEFSVRTRAVHFAEYVQNIQTVDMLESRAESSEPNWTELSLCSAARDLLCCWKDSILMNAGVCAFSRCRRRCRTLIKLRRRWWWWWWWVLLLLHMPLSHHRCGSDCLFSLFLHSSVPHSV